MTVRKRTKGIEGVVQSLRERMGRRWTVLVAALAVLVAGTLLLGLHAYRCRLGRGTAYCVRPGSLRFARAASWMTPDIAREVRSSLDDLPPALSVMDPRSATRIARCLERSAWVREVHYVRLDRPRWSGQSNGIEVSLSFRRPVAFVEIASAGAVRYYLVDRGGVRLGTEPSEEPQLGDRVLLTVTGVTSRPPAPGRVWDDPAVLAAADVANLVRRHVVKFNLSRIDVSGHRRGPDRGVPEIVLYTRRSRTRILWGGPQCRQTEILEGWTSAEKLRHLDDLYRKLGGLDGRVEYVSFPEGIWRPSRPGSRRAPSVRS